MSQLITDSFRITDTEGGPDADRLRSFRWTTGPVALLAAAEEGDVPAFSQALRRHLAQQFGKKGGRPDRLAARFPLAEPGVQDLFRRLADRQAGGPVVAGRIDPTLLSAALDGLRRFGGTLDPDTLWPLWRDGWIATAELAERPTDDSPFLRIAAGEALWAGGILYDGIGGARSRRKAGRERLFAEFDARTDTDGTPHAELLPILPAWFAGIVRATSWARVGDVRLWDSAYAKRFDGLVRVVAILSRPDGALALSAACDLRPLLAEAVKRAGPKLPEPAKRLVARLERGDASPEIPGPATRTASQHSDRKTPPVTQSDWAKLIVARSRWRPDADLLAVTHHLALPSIEFLAAGRPVMRGDWGLRIRIDGEELPATPDWEAVSWFSDKDADYLELEWPNEQAVVVCRQALLTRDGHQLVLADAVSIPKRPTVRIDVEATLPLAAGVTTGERSPQRELRLDADGLPVRVFPLALPMDRVENATGSCEAVGDQLVVRASGIGGVYLPLVFDWHPARREAFADWRTLTVTEDRRRLGPAEASSHRLRVGSSQMLVYRALNGSKAMRAVLGHHHGNESVIARFTKSGEVEPLVLVE